MNILHILSEIEKVDPEVYERLDSRRAIFKHMTGMGKTLAAAAVPMAFGAVFNKAYAQTSMAPSVLDVLNFALKLEYLESVFYNTGLGTAGAAATAVQTALRAGLSTNNVTALEKIRTDEANHVTFLRSAITAAGGTPIAAPAANEFDFTGGKGSNTGPLATVFTSPATFLAVAQALEDTGVRAYKGGAPFLASNKDVLTAALNIHSVEARHASRLRTMRRAAPTEMRPSGTAAGSNLSNTPKSWVSGTDTGGPAPAVTAPVYGAGEQPSYLPASTGITFPAEDNVSQGGITLNTQLPSLTSLNIPAAAFSEAFDEPLSVPTVLTIARTFARTGSTFF